MFLYQFAIWIIIFLIPDIHGESKETRNSVIIDQDEIAKYYTETKIIGEGLDEEKCSENVLSVTCAGARALLPTTQLP